MWQWRLTKVNPASLSLEVAEILCGNYFLLRTYDEVKEIYLW
jgi:hypothetical protein